MGLYLPNFSIIFLTSFWVLGNFTSKSSIEEDLIWKWYNYTTCYLILSHKDIQLFLQIVFPWCQFSKCYYIFLSYDLLVFEEHSLYLQNNSIKCFNSSRRISKDPLNLKCMYFVFPLNCSSWLSFLLTKCLIWWCDFSALGWIHHFWC